MVTAAKLRKTASRLAIAVLAAGAVTVALASPATAASASVGAGSVVYIENSVCTLGPLVSWTDAHGEHARGALTSGHCGAKGSRVYNSHTNDLLGVVTVSEYDEFGTEDYAIIAFHDSVRVAAPLPNKGGAEPTKGMRVRAFGGVSGNRAGEVTEVFGTSFNVSFPVANGDSGGAVYGIDTEGIHILGVIRGIDADSGGTRAVSVAHILDEVPAVAIAGAR